MTVIYADAGDDDCRVLRNVFEGLDDCTVITIHPDEPDGWEERVDAAIEAEDDWLIFLGHGSSHGLMFPDLYARHFSGQYIFHENNLELVHARHVVSFWCYASSFWRDHQFYIANNDIQLFTSGMHVSNIREAYDNCLYTVENQEQINESGTRFYRELQHLIERTRYGEIGMEGWLEECLCLKDIDDEVDCFNRDLLVYADREAILGDERIW